MMTDEERYSAVLVAELEPSASSDTELNDLFHHLVSRGMVTYSGKMLSGKGNQVLGEFPSSSDALCCAYELRASMEERSRRFPKETLRCRWGIHFGVPADGILTAGRIAAVCRPGTILLSEDAVRQAEGLRGFRFEPSGGLGEPGTSHYIRTYALSGDRGRPGRDTASDHRRKDEDIDPAEIRDAIMDEIRRAGRRIDGNWLRHKIPAGNPEIDKALNWLVDRGFLDEQARRHGGYGYSVPSDNSWGRPPDRVDSRFLRYKKKVSREASKAMPGFRAHLTTFLAVNGGLVVLNILTSRQFPWALFPIGGWGIGLFTHYVSARVRQWKQRHMEKLPDMNREQFGVLKKIHGAVGGFAGHASSNAAVAAFLLMTNLITSPSTLWSLIPITAIAIPVVIHWTGFRSKMRKLTARLKELLLEAPAGKSDSPEVSRDPSVMEAERLRGAILRQIESLGDQAYLLGDDLPGLLNSSVDYIRVVAGKIREIDLVMEEIPVVSLKQDRQKLEERLKEDGSATLQTEYRKSLAEIDGQLEGFEKLREQEELVRLKMRSSLNSMKKLQLDLARIAGTAALDSKEISSIEKEIQDITDRLNDLQAGYDELDEKV
ncbi:MAG: 2TM domain-containing protein [Spirochaetales bacterium]|nr:2TM domain-containing protein [Spirochaetales bacterium]